MEKDQAVKNLEACEKASKDDQKIINKQKVAVDNKLEQIVKEFETLKKKQVIKELTCKVCDISFENTVTLTQHIREMHHRDQVCQTRKSVANVTIQTDDNEIICDYPCFYCDHIIASFDDLMSHIGDCPVC